MCYFAYSSKTNQRIAPIFTHSNDGASGSAQNFFWRDLPSSFLFDVGLTSSRRSKRLIRILSTKIRADALAGLSKYNYSCWRRSNNKPTAKHRMHIDPTSAGVVVLPGITRRNYVWHTRPLDDEMEYIIFSPLLLFLANTPTQVDVRPISMQRLRRWLDIDPT